MNWKKVRTSHPPASSILLDADLDFLSLAPLPPGGNLWLMSPSLVIGHKGPAGW